MKKTLTLICLLILVLAGFSQGLTRDGFIEVLGKKGDGPEVQQFFSSYHVKNITGNKYGSVENGIDLETKGDSVVQVNVYRNSPVYGGFKGKLSKDLQFGMTPAQVKARLGQPATTYTNSGYAEYQYDTFVITCWYEQGVLSQLSFSPRAR